MRGSILYHLKRPAEALLDFGHVLALDPNHAAAWHYRGSALLALGRHEEASQAADRAYRLAPDKYHWKTFTAES